MSTLSSTQFAQAQTSCIDLFADSLQQSGFSVGDQNLIELSLLIRTITTRENPSELSYRNLFAALKSDSNEFNLFV